MYGTSPEMLAKMYVAGSLKNEGEGFVFSIKNKVDSGSISGIAKLSVDDQERSLGGAHDQYAGQRAQSGTDQLSHR